jgi:hypothetical protein
MALTQVDQGLLGTNAQYTGFKNRLINSAMVIDQRNAGASISAATLGSFGYTVDRWFFQGSQSAKFSAQQNQGSVTPPAGFTNYLGLTVASAVSVGASDYFFLQQSIEGFNIADLGWGTANAQTVTLSFKVYSSLTGTFGGCIRGGAVAASYPFTYSIPVANTWTTISVTIAGNTGGTWASTNATGLGVAFGLGAGSSFSGTAGSWSSSNYVTATGATSVVGTNGATFYITGVQLEKGSTATSFDYRPYGTELALCQRYFQTWGGNSTYERIATGYAVSSTQIEVFIPRYYAPMRSAPSLSVNSASNFRASDAGVSYTATAVAISQASPLSCGIIVTVSSGLTQYRAMSMDTNNTTSALLSLSAEL